MKRAGLSLALLLLIAGTSYAAYSGGTWAGNGGPAGPQGPAGSDGSDGAPGVPGYSPNQVTSGCGVFNRPSTLILDVAPCTVSIAGTAYSIAGTAVTLDAADGTHPRIDLIVARESGGTATVTTVSGTPAASPASPAIDPATEVQIGFATIAAGATAPTGITSTVVHNGTDSVAWTATASDASNVVDSTSNPRSGTKDIEGTTVAANDLVTIVNSGTIALSSYNTLTLWIRSKATWATGSELSFQWYNGTPGNSTRVGSAVSVRASGTFQFNSATTGSYQQIVIPTSLFGAGGNNVDRFRITKAGSGTVGYYIDDIVLQGGVQQTISGSASLVWRGTWASTANYVVNDGVSYGGLAYIALAINTAVTPGTDATKWASLTSANALKSSLGVFIGDPNGSAMVDTMDTPACFINQLGYAITITKCCCTVDSTTGTPAVMFQRDDGSAANILSGNLSCATAAGSGCTTSFSGTENVIADGQEVDCNLATAGGTAKWASMQCAYTVP